MAAFGLLSVKFNRRQIVHGEFPLVHLRILLMAINKLFGSFLNLPFSFLVSTIALVLLAAADTVGVHLVAWLL